MNSLARYVDDALRVPAIHDRKPYTDACTIFCGAWTAVYGIVSCGIMDAGTIACTAEEVAGDALGNVFEACRCAVIVGPLHAEELGGAVVLCVIVCSKGESIVEGVGYADAES